MIWNGKLCLEGELMLVRGWPCFLLDSIANERRYDQQQLGYEGHVVTCRDVALMRQQHKQTPNTVSSWHCTVRGRTASLSATILTARRICAAAKLVGRF